MILKPNFQISKRQLLINILQARHFHVKCLEIKFLSFNMM